LVNTPSFSKLVQDIELCVHDLNGALLCDVVETYDTV
jgi:hypothetical protein